MASRTWAVVVQIRPPGMFDARMVLLPSNSFEWPSNVHVQVFSCAHQDHYDWLLGRTSLQISLIFISVARMTVTYSDKILTANRLGAFSQLLFLYVIPNIYALQSFGLLKNLPFSQVERKCVQIGLGRSDGLSCTLLWHKCHLSLCPQRMATEVSNFCSKIELCSSKIVNSK